MITHKLFQSKKDPTIMVKGGLQLQTQNENYRDTHDLKIPIYPVCRLDSINEQRGNFVIVNTVVMNHQFCRETRARPSQ